MKFVRLLSLLGLCAVTAGCSLIEGAGRTLIVEPYEYCYYLGRHQERHRDYQMAARAWAQLAASHPDQTYSPDFARGFQEGYADYLFAGGNGQPPYIAPRRYWKIDYQSPQGTAAVNDWFAGFRLGAATAAGSGQRQFITVPSTGPVVQNSIQGVGPAAQGIPPVPPAHDLEAGPFPPGGPLPPQGQMPPGGPLPSADPFAPPVGPIGQPQLAPPFMSQDQTPYAPEYIPQGDPNAPLPLLDGLSEPLSLPPIPEAMPEPTPAFSNSTTVSPDVASPEVASPEVAIPAMVIPVRLSPVELPPPVMQTLPVVEQSPPAAEPAPPVAVYVPSPVQMPVTSQAADPRQQASSLMGVALPDWPTDAPNTTAQPDRPLQPSVPAQPSGMVEQLPAEPQQPQPTPAVRGPTLMRLPPPALNEQSQARAPAPRQWFRLPPINR
jgi:hypothetical protein